MSDNPTSGQIPTHRSESSPAPQIAGCGICCSPFIRAFAQPLTARATGALALLAGFLPPREYRRDSGHPCELRQRPRRGIGTTHAPPCCRRASSRPLRSRDPSREDPGFRRVGTRSGRARGSLRPYRPKRAAPMARPRAPRRAGSTPRYQRRFDPHANATPPAEVFATHAQNRDGARSTAKSTSRARAIAPSSSPTTARRPASGSKPRPANESRSKRTIRTGARQRNASRTRMAASNEKVTDRNRGRRQLNRRRRRIRRALSTSSGSKVCSTMPGIERSRLNYRPGFQGRSALV